MKDELKLGLEEGRVDLDCEHSFLQRWLTYTYVLALELLNERKVNAWVDFLGLERLRMDESKAFVCASYALSPVKCAYLVEGFETIRLIIVNQP